MKKLILILTPTTAFAGGMSTPGNLDEVILLGLLFAAVFLFIGIEKGLRWLVKKMFNKHHLTH